MFLKIICLTIICQVYTYRLLYEEVSQDEPKPYSSSILQLNTTDIELLRYGNYFNLSNVALLPPRSCANLPLCCRFNCPTTNLCTNVARMECQAPFAGGPGAITAGTPCVFTPVACAACATFTCPNVVAGAGVCMGAPMVICPQGL